MNTTPRRRVFMWNAVFGYSALGFTLARNVLLVPLYLAFIDLGEYGAWLATGGAFVQLLVTDFGLAGVITQRIAARAGAQDSASLGALVSAGLANAAVLGLGMSALSSLAALWLPATQGLDEPQLRRVLECFLVAVAANGCGVISAAALAALRGAQRPVSAGFITLSADLASVAVTIACLFAGWGLYALALGLLTRSLVGMCAGLAALAPLYRGAARVWPRWSDSLSMWRDSLRFFVTSVAMRLQSQANILLVGGLLGPHAAAIYGLTVRAHETVHIVMGQLNSAFGPVLAHLAGGGHLDRLNEVMRRLLPLVTALATLGAACVVVLNQSFVGLWVGPATFGGLTLTVLMGIALWATSIAYLGYEALLARGEFSYIARAFAVGSLVHIAVLVSVLELFGAWAAPLALLCSSACWGTWLWRRVMASAPALASSWHALLRDSLLTGLAGAAAAAVLLALLPVAGSWPVLIVQGLATVAVIAGVLLLLRPALRRALREEAVATLRSLRVA